MLKGDWRDTIEIRKGVDASEVFQTLERILEDYEEEKAAAKATAKARAKAKASARPKAIKVGASQTESGPFALLSTDEQIHVFVQLPFDMRLTCGTAVCKSWRGIRKMPVWDSIEFVHPDKKTDVSFWPSAPGFQRLMKVLPRDKVRCVTIRDLTRDSYVCRTGNGPVLARIRAILSKLPSLTSVTMHGEALEEKMRFHHHEVESLISQSALLTCAHQPSAAGLRDLELDFGPSTNFVVLEAALRRMPALTALRLPTTPEERGYSLENPFGYLAGLAQALSEARSDHSPRLECLHLGNDLPARYQACTAWTWRSLCKLGEWLPRLKELRMQINLASVDKQCQRIAESEPSMQQLSRLPCLELLELVMPWELYGRDYDHTPSWTKEGHHDHTSENICSLLSAILDAEKTPLLMHLRLRSAKNYDEKHEFREKYDSESPYSLKKVRRHPAPPPSVLAGVEGLPALLGRPSVAELCTRLRTLELDGFEVTTGTCPPMPSLMRLQLSGAGSDSLPENDGTLFAARLKAWQGR